jgi:GTPase SAR1 family protein
MDDFKYESAPTGNNSNTNTNSNSNADAPEKENLWNQFLKQSVSAGRGLQHTGHLIIFGDANSGKTSLVSQFQKLESRTGDMKKFLMMRYSYVHLTSTDSDESRALLNIWQISEPAHAAVLDVVIPVQHMTNVCYMICLDLTLPALVEKTYLKWMEVLTETHNRLFGRLSAQAQGQLQDKVYQHIRFYVNPKDNDAEPFTEEEKAEMEIQRTNPEINFGLPIIIVATKCDAFRKLFKAEAAAEDRFDILCSYIRMWSLTHGAASFSMAKGEKDQARRILSYIDHRIFDHEFTRGPNAVVKLSNLAEKFLFIPSGFDSLETITAQNPNRSMSDAFETVFKPPQESKQSNSKKKPKLKAETNVHFLRTLKFTLDTADRGGPSSSSRQGRQTGRQPEQQTTVENFFSKLLQNGGNSNTNSQT